MKKSIVVLGSLIAMNSFAFAGGEIVPVSASPMGTADNSSFYVGLGFSGISTRDAASSLNFFNDEAGQDRLVNITLQAGYDYNEYIAFEGRYTTTIARDDIVEMNGWSIFVKPQYPVTEDFNVYALLGFGGITLDPASLNYVDVDDNGFQWGLGASYEITENISVFADYTNLANDMDGIYGNGALQVDADALTLGLTYKF